MTDLQNGQIHHKISTLEGQSGAPIIVDLEGRLLAIGLVKGAKVNRETKLPEYNVGPLFNNIFIKKLKEFIRKVNVRPVHIYSLNILEWNKNSMSIPDSF